MTSGDIVAGLTVRPRCCSSPRAIAASGAGGFGPVVSVVVVDSLEGYSRRQ